MDESCRIAHAKILSGRCPWCGRTIEKGEPLDSMGTLAHLLSGTHQTDASSIRKIILSRGPLPPKTAVQYTMNVAMQLQAHFSTAAHKGVSPETIFIDAFENVFLGPPITIGDETDAMFDNGESVFEIAYYLAPEVALNSHKADRRSDIYSLGCLLFYMLTAQAPFQGISITEVLVKHQVEAPASANKVNPQVPESLANICQKMMAKKPVDRYQSMKELNVAFAIWLDE